MAKIKIFKKLTEFKNLEYKKLIKNLIKFEISKKISFSNFNIRLVFIKLKQVFTKTLIFKYFNLKYYT